MGKIPDSEDLQIKGPGGELETLLEMPAEAALHGVAVVCHPHPVHGGTMQNKVVHSLARAFVSQDFATLRFNFRGVGRSDGVFDEGEGELQDTLAAVEWARFRFPDMPLWVAGFSFGGAMAIRAAAETDVAGLVSVAPPVSRFASGLAHLPACPWLIIQGDEDELVDIEETVAYVNSLDPGPGLAVFPGGDHFFHGRLVELRNTVETFVEKWA